MPTYFVWWLIMLDWFVSAYNDFVDFLYALLLTLGDMFKDLFLWFLEQLLEVGEMLLSGVGDMLSGLDIASYFSAIPSETAYILNAIGLSQALGMIVTSLGIRFLLQMIPFVRWGS